MSEREENCRVPFIITALRILNPNVLQVSPQIKPTHTRISEKCVGSSCSVIVHSLKIVTRPQTVLLHCPPLKPVTVSMFIHPDFCSYTVLK
jgi:hypothetical protein